MNRSQQRTSKSIRRFEPTKLHENKEKNENASFIQWPRNIMGKASRKKPNGIQNYLDAYKELIRFANEDQQITIGESFWALPFFSNSLE